MHNISLLEECYNEFIKDPSKKLPDAIVHIDLPLLKTLNLLNYHRSDYQDPSLTRYFHVIESNDKITLINEEFVVWIVPEHRGEEPVTYCLIATNQKENTPKLEMAFLARGVYNTSKLVLRVLEKYLIEIQENNDFFKGLHI